MADSNDSLLCLPTEEEKVEALKTPVSARPGDDSNIANMTSGDYLETRLVECHQKVMQKLEKQERLLRHIATQNDANASMSSFNSQQQVRSKRPSQFSTNPRSLEVAQRIDSIRRDSLRESVNEGSPASDGKVSTASSVRLFKSYSAHQMDLKAEAQNVHRKHSSQRRGTSRVERVVGRSILCTKETWKKMERIVQSPYFDLFFAVIVFMNAIFMGVEVQSSIDGDWLPRRLPQVVNYVFAVFFTMELIIRYCFSKAGGFFCSEDYLWNWLDLFVVLSSITEIIIDILTSIQHGDQYEDLSHMSGLKLFRMVKLTKVVKTVRLVRIFRFVMALRTLVTSIAHTLKALFWALTLLAMIVYVFGVLFAQAIHDHINDPNLPTLSVEADQARERYFGTLLDTMLSLFMSIAGGVSWEHVIFPLREVNVVWVFFFLFYVSFTYFAVLNVVTGVFCQSAIENAQKDHAAVVQNILDNKESHLKKIRDLFNELGGTEDTGIITYDMLQEHLRKPAVREYFDSLGLDVSDAWSFFKLLDIDGGGAVEIEEFLLGCLRLRGQARAMDIAKLTYDQNWLIQSQGKFQHFVQEELAALVAEVRTQRVFTQK